MARLIDADALKRAFCNHCDGEQPCTEPCVDIWLIETAPTIDAVPVDYINQKIIELDETACRLLDDGRELMAAVVFDTVRLLGNVLKEWRAKMDGKENADV